MELRKEDLIGQMGKNLEETIQRRSTERMVF